MLSILKALLSHSLVAELPIQEQAPWRTANYQRPTYNEPCSGFTFTKFDGTTITV